MPRMEMLSGRRSFCVQGCHEPRQPSGERKSLWQTSVNHVSCVMRFQSAVAPSPDWSYQIKSSNLTFRSWSSSHVAPLSCRWEPRGARAIGCHDGASLCRLSVICLSSVSHAAMEFFLPKPTADFPERFVYIRHQLKAINSSRRSSIVVVSAN